MLAVIYDPTTGRILQTMRGAEADIKASGPAYLEVATDRNDYDATSIVQNGILMPKPAPTTDTPPATPA